MTHSLFITLVHYPVVNRNGDVVASAVTNLDLHDIARAAKTYGARRFYVATPLDDQRKIARRIVEHWTRGAGSRQNPLRKEALDLIRLTGDLVEAVTDAEAEAGAPPLVVATSANRQGKMMALSRLRSELKAGTPVMIVLGTAWGLAREAIEACDGLLEPISGCGGYNHLSVRSAAAILCDRIMGGAPGPQENRFSSKF